MTVTFWFDPGCPFTWRTSRWLRDTAPRHGTDVRWQLMSLAVLNAGNDHIPEQYKAVHRWSSRVLRVLARADERFGQEAVDRLYTALGERVHEGGEGHSDEVTARAVADAGLPADLLDAADDAALDKVVRASHDEAQARVGTDSGSPVLALDGGPGFFGPVLAPAPDAGNADRLFEALRLLSQVPEFSELKRGRNPL
jgi:2-hydroxychromene-2-carboxylate isomerase